MNNRTDMQDRCVLRTTSNISFAGTLSKDVKVEGMYGVMIKMSDASNVRIWCPYDEIKNIILPNGKELNENEIK